LGERVKRAREEKGLAQERLAVTLQWDVHRLQAVESGEIPAVPLFEICELAEALEVTTYYLEFGLKTLNGKPLRDKVKKLHQSATNFICHCKEYMLVRFERYLLWTKVMEESSHRSVISPAAWRQHHVRIFDTLQRAASPKKRTSTHAVTRRRTTRETSAQQCMCHDPDFLYRNPSLFRCLFCGRQLD